MLLSDRGYAGHATVQGNIRGGAMNDAAMRFLKSAQYAAHPEKHAHLNAMMQQPDFAWDGGTRVSPRGSLGRFGYLDVGTKWYSPGNAWRKGFDVAWGAMKAAGKAATGIMTGDPAAIAEGLGDSIKYAVDTSGAGVRRRRVYGPQRRRRRRVRGGDIDAQEMVSRHGQGRWYRGDWRTGDGRIHKA